MVDALTNGISGGASSEKSERNGGGGRDFDVIFPSKGIPN